MSFVPTAGYRVTVTRQETVWRMEVHTGTGPVRRLDDVRSRSFATEREARSAARAMCLDLREVVMWVVRVQVPDGSGWRDVRPPESVPGGPDSTPERVAGWVAVKLAGELAGWFRVAVSGDGGVFVGEYSGALTS